MDLANRIAGNIFPDGKGFTGITAGLCGRIGVAVRHGHILAFQINRRLKQMGQNSHGLGNAAGMLSVKQPEQITAGNTFH